jgi:hypothetical protein
MGDRNQQIKIGPSSVKRLQQTFDIPSVQVVNKPTNAYTDKTGVGAAIDNPLYYSALGTPVYSDLTLGDLSNWAANRYTDNNGVVRQFTPMTFSTVLLTVAQDKRIVTTEIDGRDGTVKEYIGMDDFSVTINGIIPGTNGHYPIDEVNQLWQILKAPIAIASVAWWLQIWDIHNVVIKSFNLPQNPGGYSEQSFSITALSDAAQEILFIPSS